MKHIVVASLAVLALVACRSQDAAKAPGTRSTVATEGALCSEHGVLEAVCTKCNPALAAVFKAKGDWCAEHGLPESICPTCHPERGGKPDTKLTAEAAPADGTKVRFKTKEAARLAGLSLAKVEEGPIRSTLTATARLVYDAGRIAQINARSPGVVREIRADIGKKVRAGTPLATLESAGVAADHSRVQAARSRVQVADSNHARAARLHSEGIAAEREVLAARQELDAARAELASAQAALGMVGGTSGGASRYTLTASISGVVTQRNATLGRLVGVEEILFEVVDASTLWAEIDVPEADLSRVAPGQAVSLALDAAPDRPLSGTLAFVAPSIDPRTRTAQGRIALPNPDGTLRANMFGRATIAVGGARTGLTVPRAAVQRARGASLVFVRLADDLFEARRVELGDSEGERVEVKGRLQSGDEVVVEGGFLLKTETLKESIGAGCCDVEEGKR